MLRSIYDPFSFVDISPVNAKKKVQRKLQRRQMCSQISFVVVLNEVRKNVSISSVCMNPYEFQVFVRQDLDPGAS